MTLSLFERLRQFCHSPKRRHCLGPMTQHSRKDFGTGLRAARESAGLVAAADLADSTKLSVRAFDALEKNRIAQLPGRHLSSRDRARVRVGSRTRSGDRRCARFSRCIRTRCRRRQTSNWRRRRAADRCARCSVSSARSFPSSPACSTSRTACAASTCRAARSRCRRRRWTSVGDASPAALRAQPGDDDAVDLGADRARGRGRRPPGARARRRTRRNAARRAQQRSHARRRRRRRRAHEHQRARRASAWARTGRRSTSASIASPIDDWLIESR